MKILLFIIVIYSTLFSDFLNKTYYVDSKDIKISDIISNSDDNIVIFNIEKNRYTKRVKSKKIIELLKVNGYKDFKTKHNYVKFVLNSPIDTTKIQNYIKDSYQDKYKNMKILNIKVNPRNYIEYIGNNYEVFLQNNSLQHNEGIVYIKTENKKKFFFNYEIEAYIDIYSSKIKIKRDSKITLLNTNKRYIKFHKFRALPISTKDIDNVQSKNNIKENSIITVKDIEKVDIVTKGSTVNVRMNSKNIAISFIAKALRSGKLNDTITVKKLNGKKFRVVVVGKNRVEIQWKKEKLF